MTNSDAHHLLVSQRNEIFTTLQNRGFAPADFELRDIDIDKRKGVRLVHKTTNYRFLIYIRPHTPSPFLTLLSPGAELLSEVDNCATWSEVVMNLSLWISYLLRETEVPDLWDGLEGGNQLLQDAENQPADNLPFTPAELPQARSALEEIKAYVIKTHELTETQKKMVDARFAHMEEAATRMGRKDWLTLVMGALLSLAVGLVLDGSSTHHLFDLAGVVIKRTLGTMLYLAGPH